MNTNGPTRIVGIDYSTFFVDAVALWSDGHDSGSWTRLALRHKEDNDLPDDAAFAAARRVRAIHSWEWKTGDVAYVEAPIVAGRNAATTVKLSRVQGAVLSAIPALVHVEEIHPNVWKRQFCGKGGATKDEIRLRALELGFDPPQAAEDAFDAFGIAWTQRQATVRALRGQALVF